jgi:hypothetical protein
MTTAKYQWTHIVNREKDGGKYICTLGIHPTEDVMKGFNRGQCDCFSYADKQCCSQLTPCKLHGCGARKGCKCPLPES